MTRKKLRNSLLSFIVFLLSNITFAAEMDLRHQAKDINQKPNSLINQSSPYLLQHAYNPVQWYAWSDEAFKLARKQNKPIFLSIGYSTCHWCHVMAHESFENKVIADYLNKHFISIKVDREERPDIDKIYMSATQLINGHGGWPMSVFLDQKLRPFYAATYFPPFSNITEMGQKRIGFLSVLKEINRLWESHPKKIQTTAENVTTIIKQNTNRQINPSEKESKLDNEITAKLMYQLENTFDEEYGGFGSAPKFPNPGKFAFLITQAKSKNLFSTDAKNMMRTTLNAMLAGGIYDQIGGGFHRYSVDSRWRIPHFEKMLYNQALMTITYLDYYQLEPTPAYREVIQDTLDFVRRDMQSPSGGFYSAYDADSENGIEGAYYLWQQTELKNILNKDEFNLIKKHFGILEEGNMTAGHSDSDSADNDNILSITKSKKVDLVDDDEKPLSIKDNKNLESAKRKLLSARSKKPRPHLDDKIITAWNGMMITAYAKAEKTFKTQNKDYLNVAIKSADFILNNLHDMKHKKLFRHYRKGKMNAQATLNDYVWLISGLISINDVAPDEKWEKWISRLLSEQNTLFFDHENGAYYEFIGGDINMLFRSKTIFDDALPAANSIAAGNFLNLAKQASTKIDKDFYLKQANDIITIFSVDINSNPVHSAMILSFPNLLPE